MMIRNPFIARLLPYIVFLLPVLMIAAICTLVKRNDTNGMILGLVLTLASGGCCVIVFYILMGW